jgi:hypothetical protein
MRILFTLILAINLQFLPLLPFVVDGQATQISQASPLRGQKAASLGLQNNSDEIRDIHGPLATSESPVRTVAFLAVGILSALVCCLYFFWKRRETTLESGLSAGLLALSELNEIRALRNSGRPFFYMERISEILRQYIEARFSIPCSRITSLEFIQAVRSSTAENSSLQSFSAELQYCLEMCDMAKFSGRQPAHVEMVQVEQVIRDFIEQTDERPIIPGES